MSLNWDLTKIKDNDDLWIPTGKIDKDGEPEKQLWPVTEGLIWYTMVVDMGNITKENVQEFYYRMVLFDLLSGPLLMTSEGPRPITLDEVTRHIGLHTNVSTTKSGPFLAKQWRMHKDRVARRLKEHKE